jgi:hypothetical protein
VAQLEQVTAHFGGSRLRGDVQELPLRSRCAARNGSGLSFCRAAWCEGVLQLLELRHCCRILLSCRSALVQSFGVVAAGRCRTAGNRICFLHCSLRLILRLRRLDLILIGAGTGDCEPRGGLRRIGRADGGILLRTVRSGLHILDDLPQRGGIVNPIQHSLAADQAQSLWIDAELLQHAVKLLQSLLRWRGARCAYRCRSRGRVCGSCRDGRLSARGCLRRRCRSHGRSVSLDRRWRRSGSGVLTRWKSRCLGQQCEGRGLSVSCRRCVLLALLRQECSGEGHRILGDLGHWSSGDPARRKHRAGGLGLRKVGVLRRVGSRAVVERRDL